VPQEGYKKPQGLCNGDIAVDSKSRCPVFVANEMSGFG
jgi:hypothetical protein